MPCREQDAGRADTTNYQGEAREYAGCDDSAAGSTDSRGRYGGSYRVVDEPDGFISSLARGLQ
jgi:hypothetical protein